MVYEIHRMDCVKPLFDGWEESIIWSCLQGVMGRVYANDQKKPTAAMAILGDFCFLAGTSNVEMASYKPEWCKQDFMIMVPQNQGWADEIEAVYGTRAKKVMRYAIKKEQGIFDREYLKDIIEALPKEFSLHIIDEVLFKGCRSQPWSRDLVAQYSSYRKYPKWGLGVVAVKDGEIVSGASSYSSYRGGIEIEIDTREDQRRKGLALACGAKLILACMDRGLYPSWDAQNKASVALAEKLGYHFSHEYMAYEIWRY